MLKDKTAIVIGGGRDIGRSTSIALAKEGANVVVSYNNDETSAINTVEEIISAGGSAITHKADATKLSDMLMLVEKTIQTYGSKIDILANVVGGLVERRSIDQMDEDFFDSVIRLNLHSVFFAVKATLPYLASGASIVNFASQAGRDGGGPGAMAYAAGKGGVMTMTRAMAKEFGPQGIRVNAICPGMIATSFHDRFTKDEVRSNVAASTPLRRQGDASEVADMATYLASDKSSFVTGACFDINGGLLFS